MAFGTWKPSLLLVHLFWSARSYRRPSPIIECSTMAGFSPSMSNQIICFPQMVIFKFEHHGRQCDDLKVDSYGLKLKISELWISLGNNNLNQQDSISNRQGNGSSGICWTHTRECLVGVDSKILPLVINLQADLSKPLFRSSAKSKSACSINLHIKI